MENSLAWTILALLIFILSKISDDNYYRRMSRDEITPFLSENGQKNYAHARLIWLRSLFASLAMGLISTLNEIFKSEKIIDLWTSNLALTTIIWLFFLSVGVGFVGALYHCAYKKRGYNFLLFHICLTLINFIQMFFAHFKEVFTLAFLGQILFLVSCFPLYRNNRLYQKSLHLKAIENDQQIATENFSEHA